MSQRKEPRDPTGRRATTAESLRFMMTVLNSLDARDKMVIVRRFGILDGDPKTRAELGQTYGVTSARIRQIEAKALSRLRHPKRTYPLRDFVDDVGSLSSLPGHVQERLFKQLGIERPQPRPLVFCERHGWRDPFSFRRTCVGCPCYMADAENRMGRPRKYCSAACRQADYRRRQRAPSRRRRRPASGGSDLQSGT